MTTHHFRTDMDPFPGRTCRTWREAASTWKRRGPGGSPPLPVNVQQW